MKGQKVTLGDCSPDGTPKCFHCERDLPSATRISVDKDYIVALCPFCGCMTPFRRTA